MSVDLSAATTAAAEAIEDSALEALGRTLGTIHRDEIVHDGLMAALPLIEAQVREMVAQEIEQLASDRSYDSEENITESLLGAARIARGATS